MANSYLTPLSSVFATNNMRANGPSGGWGPGNPAPSDTAGGPLNPILWDPGAATVAQGWAAQCQGLTHNTNRDGGENIYIAGSTTTPVTITGTDAVSSWSSEAADYTYSPTGGSCAAGDECGHFTQLAWRTTTAVGCAVQQCTTNSPFGESFPDYALVVCDYTPAGNWSGVAPY
jgi:pathogenesis-related protein 1